MDTGRVAAHSRTVFNKTRIAMHTTPRPDTKAWKLQVWVSFGTAVALAGTGLAWLFLISASFTLAKTLRDAHEVALMERSGVQVQEQEQIIKAN